VVHPPTLASRRIVRMRTSPVWLVLFAPRRPGVPRLGVCLIGRGADTGRRRHLFLRILRRCAVSGIAIGRHRRAVKDRVPAPGGRLRES